MALIEAEFHAHLVGDMDITALVATRIFPNKTPVGVTYPCVTYFKVSDIPASDMNGCTGLTKARFQVNAWSFDYGNAKAIADAIRKRLGSFRGTMGSTQIDAIQRLDGGDITDKKLAVDSSIPHGVRGDYEVRYREATDENT